MKNTEIAATLRIAAETVESIALKMLVLTAADRLDEIGDVMKMKLDMLEIINETYQQNATQLHNALTYLMQEAVANGMVTAEPAIVQAKAAIKLVVPS